MKSTFRRYAMLTMLALASASAIVQAAPPPAGNPPPPKARPQQPERPRMSPEERREKTEDRLREMMAANSITDNSTQDTVLAFLANELEARRPLRQLGNKLQRALSGQDTTDAQIKALIADYQNAQDLENQRRAKAQDELDKSIHYSENPRLQGLLLLMGVLGDGPPLMQAPRRANQHAGNNRPRPNGERGGGNPEMRKQIMEMFDKNNDGKLDANERSAMQAHRQQQRKNQNKGQNPPPANNKQMNDDN